MIVSLSLSSNHFFCFSLYKPNQRRRTVYRSKIIYYLPTSCLVFFFLFSLFHLLSCVSSQQELRLCETLFQCGNITAGFPFSGENRPLACGYPSLKLHCYKNKTSIIILNHLYDVLDIDQTSNTLRLSKAELLGSFCNATFTATTLPPEIFELSPNYKHLSVFYLCDPKLPYRSSYTCPGTGPVSVSENLDYHNTCDASFRVYVPKSFVPEEKELNITNLESALSEGFEVKVKVKNDEKACQKCSSSHGICGFLDAAQTSSEFVCHCVDETDNRYSCGSYVSPNAANGRRKFGVVTGSVVGGFMFLFLVIAIFLQIFPKGNRNESDDLSQQNLKDLTLQQDSKTLIPQQNLKALNAQQDLKALIPLKQYSYATVKRITKSFAQVVGQGGFGTVYRGTLCDGRSVAVKILKNSKGTNGEDFINEVASMSLTSHVNIVTLLGFCSEGSKRAILYEFLENGSLDKFISSKRSSNMDWMALYRIALGVARGLEYLHHGCRTRIVHFDIKPHNVLLDDNLCPKVSDFGLAKLCKKKESILSLLDTRGTIGYIAPEVFSRMYGRVSHKSDVYNYGMLVLEMIGARNKERADQNSASDASSMYFPEWIYKDLEEGENGRLNGNGVSSEEEEIAKKMTLVGLWCIQSYPSDRPPMNRVVEMMEGNLDALAVPPRPVLKTLPAHLQDSSTLSEDISVYTEVCSINGA